MIASKRTGHWRAVIALSLLLPSTSLAGEVSTGNRPVIVGDRVRVSGQHNTLGFSTGEGQVFAADGAGVLLRASLISGPTVASSVTVIGLTGAGAPVAGCAASVSGPLPKDPKLVQCAATVTRFRTTVRFSEI